MPSVRVFYPRWTREDLLLRLRQGVEALRREVPLEEAWLFGSWAKGRALPGSDVDLSWSTGEPQGLTSTAWCEGLSRGFR